MRGAERSGPCAAIQYNSAASHTARENGCARILCAPHSAGIHPGNPSTCCANQLRCCLLGNCAAASLPEASAAASLPEASAELLGARHYESRLTRGRLGIWDTSAGAFGRSQGVGDKAQGSAECRAASPPDSRMGRHRVDVSIRRQVGQAAIGFRDCLQGKQGRPAGWPRAASWSQHQSAATSTHLGAPLADGGAGGQVKLGAVGRAGHAAARGQARAGTLQGWASSR